VKRSTKVTYRGYAAIRTVSAKLFDAMGLGRWLAHERRKASERRRDRTEKARRKALANAHMAMHGQHGAKKPVMNTEQLRAASAAPAG